MAVFRVEKTKDFTIMSNHHLRNISLSLKAKGLLSLMLSLPDKWDYTTKGLSAICKDGVDSITTGIKELEKHGYLTRRRVRNDKGQVTFTEFTIHEIPKQSQSKKPKLDYPVQAKPIQENPPQLSTNQLSKDISSTNQSIYPDRMDGIETWTGIIYDNIQYDILCERYDIELVNELIAIMLDTICAKRKTVTVGKGDMPYEYVKERLLSLTFEHIAYVIECFKENTTQITNIKAYLLTSLYNAPASINSYNQSQFNYGMYGGDK